MRPKQRGWCGRIRSVLPSYLGITSSACEGGRKRLSTSPSLHPKPNNATMPSVPLDQLHVPSLFALIKILCRVVSLLTSIIALVFLIYISAKFGKNFPVAYAAVSCRRPYLDFYTDRRGRQSTPGSSIQRTSFHQPTDTAQSHDSRRCF